MKNVDENDFHFLKTQLIDSRWNKASDVKSVAKEEFKDLIEKISKEKEEFDKSMEESSLLKRAWSGGENNFKSEIVHSINDGKYGNLNSLKQYICFSAENGRFFDSGF